jgi:hypothetical protein
MSRLAALAKSASLMVNLPIARSWARKQTDCEFQTREMPVKKLALVGGKAYNGNAANEFKDAEPFSFSPANAN